MKSKAIFIAIFLCFSSFLQAGRNFQLFSLYEFPSQFSTQYSFYSESGDSLDATVQRKRFVYLNMRTNYEVYQKENLVATGVARLFSLGALFSWATQIDISSPTGKKMGFIDGKLLTLTHAKFALYEYDEKGERLLKAVAYLDNDSGIINIVAPYDDAKSLGALRRKKADEQTAAYWQGQIANPTFINPAVLFVFSSFIADHKDHFTGL